MEKAIKTFTNREFDFRFTATSNKGRRINKKKDLEVTVWVEPDDDQGYKRFKFLCNDRVWGDDEPSEIKYNPETDEILMRHPKGLFRRMPKSQAELFLKAYEEEYVTTQILIGGDDEEEQRE